jgi:hypothetical protein
VLDSPLAGGDLVVWTSGEAEPQVVYEDGRARLTHYDDLRARDDLRSAIAEVALLVTHRPQEHTLIDLIRP